MNLLERYAGALLLVLFICASAIGTYLGVHAPTVHRLITYPMLFAGTLLAFFTYATLWYRTRRANGYSTSLLILNLFVEGAWLMVVVAIILLIVDDIYPPFPDFPPDEWMRGLITGASSVILVRGILFFFGRNHGASSWIRRPARLLPWTKRRDRGE